MHPRDEHFRKLERMYASAPINAYFAPTLHVSDACADVSITVRPEFFHAAHALHGSVYFKALETERTIKADDARLDPRRFLRLDHSTVVNLARIGELIPHTHQRYRLVFTDAAKTELMLSRDVGRRLRAALGW